MSDNIFMLLVYTTAILIALVLTGIAESVSARVSVKKSDPPDSRWVIETRQWVVADTSLLRAFARLVTATFKS